MVLREHHRRFDLDHVVVGAVDRQQHPGLLGGVDDVARQGGVGLLRGPIGDQLDAEEEAAAAHVADGGVFSHQRP